MERPGILHQNKASHIVWSFFVCTKRVRHLLHWESAVHGRQEVTVIGTARYSSPEQGITHCVVLFCLHQTSEAFAPLGERRAWTARGHRDWNGPVFSTKKALYFVGSMVLFFSLKPVFGDCIASPAPFSGFCGRFLYNPQLLTLHRFQKRMFAARFFSRLLHHPLQCTA